jgi:hypothetical protein
MGPLDNDKLLFVILINCLERDFPQLQSDIHGMTDNPILTSADAVKRIRTEACLNKHRNELSPSAPTVALAATSTGGKDAIVCSNCKKLHHTIDFCIKRGGKMAGCTIDDARAAQHLAAGKPARPATAARRGTSTASSALTATAALSALAAPSPGTLGSVVIGGVTYALTPVPSAAPASVNVALSSPGLSQAAVSSGTSPNMTNLVQYSAFLSDHDMPRASLDWKEFAHDTNIRSLEALTAELGSVPLSTEKCLFLMDTGATCHISPDCADFLKLSPIAPHPVQGLGDSCVYAVGIGVLSLPLDTGKSLLLQKALFIPASKVCLLSVLSLNRAGDFVSRLKIITTDNGELLSNATANWCATHGIIHQLTAPHTSAHNGHVEHLHRTIMGKARAMQLACNAPSDIWDEFCSTAAYLTNFTASTSNGGKTPHELWFLSVPSLAHL